MPAPQPCLFIVTSLFEPNVNQVVRRLDELGVPWFRFNTESFPLLCRGQLQFLDHNGPFFQLEQDGRAIDSRHITAVWYRRQSEPVLADGLAERDREFARLECLGFLNSLYRCLDHSRWVNPWLAERQAADKMMQLSLARCARAAHSPHPSDERSPGGP